MKGIILAGGAGTREEFVCRCLSLQNYNLSSLLPFRIENNQYVRV